MRHLINKASAPQRVVVIIGVLSPRYLSNELDGLLMIVLFLVGVIWNRLERKKNRKKTPRLLIKQLKYMPAILRSGVVRPNREDLRDIVLNKVPPEYQDVALDALMPDSGRAACDMSLTGVPVDAGRVRVRCSRSRRTRIDSSLRQL